jgi:AraC-like DNA-binding protein
MKMIFRDLPPAIDSSFAVKQEQGSQFKAPFHFHHGYEFTFIVKGYGKFYGGNKVMNFKAGDVYFFGPGFAHYFVLEKSFVLSGESAHSIAIQFTEDFLGEDFFKKPELRKFQKLLKASSSGLRLNDPDKQLASIFLQLASEKDLKALILLFQLFQHFSEKGGNNFSLISPNPLNNSFNDADSGKMAAVFKYVLENFKEEVNSKSAASLACLNEAAFCRYFKRRTKKTFSQFVNDVRITHATHLLEETDHNITQICFESGFNNISYFNRQFKEITGRKPFEYRKKM